jgi:two-component system chemotaxis response regulator CheY
MIRRSVARDDEPMKVMIVDDHEKMRTTLRLVVDSAGSGPHEYCECRNGAEAVATYAAFRPDAVLMDVSMPEKDGLTAAQEIIASDPKASIIMITMHPVEEYAEASRRAGAMTIVSKERLSELTGVLEGIKK